ncbi:MAG: hypothetical protein CL578_10630 [Alteromonadaceae bacterium]|uniref:hypothetical protein n=1 Tax=Paraglaciecola chathamensis TaxID=368405 RepID=UPI000C440AFC|nr:hypothetical protein [Paraglaciecola agarilytica]MBN25492.1 hypothetical protein [Alteromonadaceae bacterium]
MLKLMDSLAEERYVFYRLCAGDIQECVKSLEMLSDAVSDRMRVVLVKASIVSYARPFSGNESRYRNKGKWRLDKIYVPNEFCEVHEQTIEYRDKLIAHSDIPHRSPELLRGGPHFAIGHNAPLDEEYIEFSKVLYPASAALLKELWDLIISYEKEWL